MTILGRYFGKFTVHFKDEQGNTCRAHAFTFNLSKQTLTNRVRGYVENSYPGALQGFKVAGITPYGVPLR